MTSPLELITPQFDDEATKAEYLARLEAVIESLHAAIHLAESIGAEAKRLQAVAVYREHCARHDGITGGNIATEHGNH